MRTKRRVIEKNGKFYTVRGSELTRNAHTMTEAEYFAMILSALRKTTRWWKPLQLQLEKQKRPSLKGDKRTKYEYQCEACNKWFIKSHVQVDHIEPCGGISGYEKVVPWLKKAHIEEGFQILCKGCHTIKTNIERGIC